MGVVKRRGVGAAISAAAIFSLILLSNSEALSAAQDQARLATTVEIESRLADDAAVSGGVAAMGVLSQVQSFLASTTLECRNATYLLGTQVSGLSSRQVVGDVIASASLALSPSAQGSDNLSVISPFNGSDEGVMDFRLQLSLKGSEGVSGVSYEKNESHLVHLPALLHEMLSLCEDSVATVASTLASANYTSCSRDALMSELGVADSALQQTAAHLGLHFSLTYSVTGTSPCAVSTLSQVWQRGIQGPDGTFTMRVEEHQAEAVGTPDG